MELAIKVKYSLTYFLVIVINIIIAARFPIGNDEAYYIAFARDIQLSYVDAPPFVAYLNFFQTHLGIFNPLANRLLVIILHLISTILLMLIVKNNLIISSNNQSNYDNDLALKLLLTFLLSYIVPIFGIYSILILPDCGLILGLSVMLWASDNILREQYISLKNSLMLGMGLGIGLLSKYHILPLGGGMILGVYLSLTLKGKGVYINLAKLTLSIILALIIALPLFIWNYNNHYASFIFQLQHGFSSGTWQLSSLLSFACGALLYLTPWFTYVFIRYGLANRKLYHIFIPVIGLAVILIVSSLRKNILPHWMAPGFWLLIPYAIINIPGVYILKSMCKYTATLWVILMLALVLPGGSLNIKNISKLFNPDTTGLADLMLWQELPALFKNNHELQNSLIILNNRPANCPAVIGTTRWYWTSQLEYHNVFGPAYKILNLDLNSSSFYLWRDDLTNYSNCPILVITTQGNYTSLAHIINIKSSYTIKGLGDYKSLKLSIIEGALKDKSVLSKFQSNLLENPRYQ